MSAGGLRSRAKPSAIEASFEMDDLIAHSGFFLVARFLDVGFELNLDWNLAMGTRTYSHSLLYGEANPTSWARE